MIALSRASFAGRETRVGPRSPVFMRLGRVTACVGLTMLLVSGCSDASQRDSSPAPSVAPSSAATSAPDTDVATSSGQARSGDSALEEWTVGRVLDVPGWGSMLYADGMLWVADTKDATLNEDGTAPAGEMYRIDPRTGRTTDRIPEAVGGFPTTSPGFLWLATLASDLDYLTRVDTSNGHVVHFATDDRPGPEPEAVAVTPHAVWVGNNFRNEIAKLDPRTGKILDAIDVTDPANTDAGPRGWAATAEGDVFFVLSWAGMVVRIDPKSDKVVSRTQLPSEGLEGVFAVESALYAFGGHDIWQLDISRVGREHAVKHATIDAGPESFITQVQSGFGSLWVLMNGPTPTLVSTDPNDLTERGRIDFPADTESSIGAMLAVSSEALWLRTTGKVYEVARRS